MVFQNPELLNALLTQLADAIADYMIYQIKSGAQAIMLFDSWGGQLPPAIWDTVSRPAVERMVKKARKNGEGGGFEAACPARVAALFARLRERGLPARESALHSVAWASLRLSLCALCAFAEIPRPLHTTQQVKAAYPEVPVVLYANGSGGLLERMGCVAQR